MKYVEIRRETQQRGSLIIMKENVKANIMAVLHSTGQYIRWLVLGGFTGIVVGLVSSLFSWCLVNATALRTSLPWLFLTLPVGGLIIVFLYRALHYESNRGTDSIIESIHGDIHLSPKMTFLIFVSTVITLLCGGSVGRESAALQIGGSLGKSLGDLLRLKQEDKKIILMSGMAAAFSALFGTPMTASFFALEVASVGSMYYAALVPCICAALVSRQAAMALGVPEELFHVSNEMTFTIPSGLRAILLAGCCAVVSILFCLSLQLFHKLMHRFLPNSYIRIATGGVLIILLTLLCGSQDYLGTGMNIIERAVEGQALPWAFLLKILFTSVTIAAGYRGGEIVPSLFIGATFGCCAAGLFGLPASLGASIGMVSLFCGVTNCPMASLLIAFELFGFSDAYYYLIAVATSYMLSGYFGLYHAQRITYSKYENRFVDRYTASWFS